MLQNIYVIKNAKAGLVILSLPEVVGGAVQSEGAAAAADRYARQLNGILVAVVGYFNYIAGRNNAEWFFAGCALERFAVALLALLLFLSGSVSLQQIAGQIIVDGGSALWVYKLYQQDLAEQEELPKQD